MANEICLVGSEKGGVGKTTLAFNLAVMRLKAGYPVLLVDADRQASSAMWAALRTEAGFKPPLVCVQMQGKIGVDLLQLKDNYEVIVDAGGADSVELRQTMLVADRWLCPVKPSQLDLFSMAKMAQLITEVKERAGRVPQTSIVLNAVSPLTHEAREARELLLEYEEEMPVLAAQLVDRVAMRHAVKAGCGVIELPPKGANELAIYEMMGVYVQFFKEHYMDKALTLTHPGHTK